MRLATTTTTVDSGLMDAILPSFEDSHGAAVDVVAVGTGEALALGRAGDVDVVLVHARPLEDEFVAAGYGINRRDVMTNTFVLLGPPADPAGVVGTQDIVAALHGIRDAQATFISRGDESGTHQREKELWALAGIAPEGQWYLSVGQGMGATLTIASEQRAYVLSDKGTYIARQDQGLELVILLERDDRLLNPYGAIVVNPDLHPEVDGQLAKEFVDWLVSPGTQAAIDGFEKNGQQLFFAQRAATP